MSNTQSNKSDTPHRPGSTIHSTHACLETFDQATREQREHEIAQEKMNSAMSSTNTTTSTTNASSSLTGSGSGSTDVWRHPGSEKEANTAVQLDRDLRQSRRMSDSDRQKASGNTRTASWTTGLPYVE